jgi:hypothetical protein
MFHVRHRAGNERALQEQSHGSPEQFQAFVSTVHSVRAAVSGVALAFVNDSLASFVVERCFWQSWKALEAAIGERTACRDSGDAGMSGSLGQGCATLARRKAERNGNS